MLEEGRGKAVVDKRGQTPSDPREFEENPRRKELTSRPIRGTRSCLRSFIY